MSQDEKIKEDKSSKKTSKEELDENKVSEEAVESENIEIEKADETVSEEKSSKISEESQDVEENENVEETGDEEVVEENISEELEGVEEVKKDEERMPDFNVGDTIRVSYKIIEGDKVRTQPYQGIVIAKKGSGVSKTFTVRKIGADGIGVERIFPFSSPNIEKVKVMKKGKVRRAKLYYLRNRIGRKATKIKEKVSQTDK